MRDILVEIAAASRGRVEVVPGDTHLTLDGIRVSQDPEGEADISLLIDYFASDGCISGPEAIRLRAELKRQYRASAIRRLGWWLRGLVLRLPATALP